MALFYSGFVTLSLVGRVAQLLRYTYRNIRVVGKLATQSNFCEIKYVHCVRQPID